MLTKAGLRDLRTPHSTRSAQLFHNPPYLGHTEGWGEDRVKLGSLHHHPPGFATLPQKPEMVQCHCLARSAQGRAGEQVSMGMRSPCPSGTSRRPQVRPPGGQCQSPASTLQGSQHGPAPLEPSGDTRGRGFSSWSHRRPGRSATLNPPARPGTHSLSALRGTSLGTARSPRPWQSTAAALQVHLCGQPAARPHTLSASPTHRKAPGTMVSGGTAAPASGGRPARAQDSAAPTIPAPPPRLTRAPAGLPPTEVPAPLQPPTWTGQVARAGAAAAPAPFRRSRRRRQSPAGRRQRRGKGRTMLPLPPPPPHAVCGRPGRHRSAARAAPPPSQNISARAHWPPAHWRRQSSELLEKREGSGAGAAPGLPAPRPLLRGAPPTGQTRSGAAFPERGRSAPRAAGAHLHLHGQEL